MALISPHRPALALLHRAWARCGRAWPQHRPQCHVITTQQPFLAVFTPVAEGVGALWTGLGPNIARNAIINAAELASYDQIKESLLK